MTEAETILKLIETVSPDDTAKLDEIDLAVWRYLYAGTNNRYAGHPNGDYAGPQFTRDRSLLKEIRPEANWFQTKLYPEVRVLGVRGSGESKVTETTMIAVYECAAISYGLKSPRLPTEELAELHAILQSLEYERSQK